jgi:REP element-mobilizing transposase RayT
VPTYSPKKIVQTIKNITAREVFARVPSVKRQLWGGAFWSSGYYIDVEFHVQPLEAPDPQLELF